MKQKFRPYPPQGVGFRLKTNQFSNILIVHFKRVVTPGRYFENSSGRVGIMQGGHKPGKSGKLREFENYQISGKTQGNLNFCRKTWKTQR